MRNTLTKAHAMQKRRALRVRKHLHGTSSKPRLCVIKSNKHIQVQLIDDDTHQVIGALSTMSKQFKNTEFAKKNKQSAKKLGEEIAQVALNKNIREIVFDRGPFMYHGILAELADAARAAGLKF